MHTSLAAQLAQLELGHLKVERIGSAASSELPDANAVEKIELRSAGLDKGEPEALRTLRKAARELPRASND